MEIMVQFNNNILPVLKLRTISQRNIVSEIMLNIILLMERSLEKIIIKKFNFQVQIVPSSKKEIATGSMMRLAIRSRSMQMSQ